MTNSRFGGSYGGGAANLTSPYVPRSNPPVRNPASSPASRGFPERIPGDQNENWLVQGAMAAMQEVPRIYETPLAPLNVLTGSEYDPETGKPIRKGLVDDILEAIGMWSPMGPGMPGKPAPGPTFADAVGVAGTVLQRTGTFASAMFNASDISTLQQIQSQGLGMDDLIPGAYTGIGTTTRVPVGLSRNSPETVRDFYDDLRTRGFFTTTDPSTGEVRTTTPEEIYDKSKDDPLGAFMYGDKPISDNGLIDFAFKMGTDPVNYLFGLGVIGKVAKGIGLTEQLVGLAGRVAPWAAAPRLVGGASLGQLEALRGVGYFDDMVKAGLRSTELAPASAGAQALIAGNASQATLKSLAFALKVAKQVYLPGRGSLGLRYLTGATAQNLGIQAVSHAAGIASQAFDPTGGQTDPEGNLIHSGFFASVHDASEAILDNHPLSGDPLFTVVTLFNTPLHQAFKATKVVKRELSAKYFGSDIAPRYAQVFAPEVRGAAATDAMYRKLGGAKFDEATGKFDLTTGDIELGKREFARLVDHVQLYQAFQRLKTDQGFILAAKSFDHTVMSGAPMMEVLRWYRDLLVKQGVIGGSKDSIKVFQNWGERQATSYMDEAGLMQMFDNPGGWAIPPDALINQWNVYINGNKALSAATGDMVGVVLGKSQNMTREGADALIAVVDRATADGMIPTDVVRGMLVSRPAMFVDPAIPRSTAEYFASLMNEGVAAGKGVHAGAKPFTYDAVELRAHLVKLRDKLPTGAELTHEAAALEGKVLDDTQMAGQAGPLRPGGVERIWTRREVEAHSLRSISDGKAAVADLKVAEQHMKDRWTKRGNYRPIETARRAAPEVMAKTMDEGPTGGGATFDPVSGKFDTGTDGFAVELPGGTRIAPGDTAALAREMQRIVRENPDALIGTWHDKAAGEVTVGPTKIASSLEEARALGGTREQFFYDRSTGKDVANPDYNPKIIIKIDTKTLTLAGAGEIPLRQPPGINELQAFVEKNKAWSIAQNHDIVDGLEKAIPRKGKPGITVETSVVSPFGKQDLLVARGADGTVDGIMGIDVPSNGYRGIYIKSELRRQGIATKLYDRAEALGYDIRTPGPKTDAGKGFVESYLKAHPAPEAPAAAPSTANLDALRASDRAHVDALKAEVARIRKDVLDLRARGEELGVVDLHYTFHDTRTGKLKVAAEDLQRVQEQSRWVSENLPNYELKRAPQLYLPWDAADSAAAAISVQRTNLGRIMFDIGPLSKLTQIIDWAIEPIAAGARRRDTIKMLYSTFMPMGAKEAEVTTFIRELARRRHEGGTLGKMQITVNRYDNSLLPSQLRQAGEVAFGKNKAVMDAVRQRFGGEFWKPLDQASNSLVRQGLRLMMKKGESRLSGQNILARTFAKGYSAWQRAGTFSSATRFIDKTMYPMFRFYTSPRWQLMNMLENDLIGMFQDGIRANRYARGSTSLATRRAYDSAQAKAYGRGTDPRLAGEAPPGSTGVPDALLAETGAVTPGWFMDPVMRNQFTFRAAEDVTKAIDALGLYSPEAKWFVDHFGTNKGTWAEQVEQMWHDFDAKGVTKTLDGAVKEVRISDAWTPEEAMMMQPFLLKLGERQAQIYDDIAHIQLGNTDRSRLERALNSYWAYWPLSYQIKSTKWMVDLLTNRMFGRQTNLGGAYMLAHANEILVEEMKNNPDFAKTLEENPTLWLVGSMLFPAVPWDQGVSLSRIPRYIGANILHLWPDYAGINSPVDAVSKSLLLGPNYDAELGSRLLSEWGVGQEASPPTIH